MGWNYRVLRFEQSDGEPWYAIHEVHYGKTGAVEGWTEEPANVGDEERDGILRVLAMMCDAVGQPVLDGKTGAVVEEERVFRDKLTLALQALKDSGILVERDGRWTHVEPVSPPSPPASETA